MKSPALSVVLPCYNEAENLPSLLESYVLAFEGIDAELILVNNGSTDNTKEVLGLELKKPKYFFVRTIDIAKNIGYGHGIYAGLKQAKGEFLAYSHADHQCDPLDVTKAYQKAKASAKPEKVLVKGDRVGRQPFFSTGFKWMASLLFLRKFNDINGQPKLFHKTFFQKWKDPPIDFALDIYVQRMAFKEGLTLTAIPVKFAERKFGQSKWAGTIISKTWTIVKYFFYLLKLRLES